MRKQHREIWAADCETDPFKFGRMPSPFIWGCYNGSEYHEFNTTEDFINFIIERECIVYAHNGGRFDWHFCLNYLEPMTRLMIIANRIAKFKIGNAEFRDSYNIVPIALAVFQKDEFDYNLLEKVKRAKHMPEIRKYLKSDCVNLWHLVNEFIERYGVNLTLASSAMKFWLKQSGNEAPKTNPYFFEKYSQFYYGGRVQVFKSGIINKPFKLADINSAYPDAMTHFHPYGDIVDCGESLPNGRDKIQRSFIEIECESRGAFPFRDKALTFPNDGIVRRFNITGWEFIAALDTGALSDYEIINVHRFLDKIEFSDYVNHFYQLKADSKLSKDRAGYIFAKLYLNTLYGKFAANPDKYKQHLIAPRENIEAAMEHGWDFAGLLGKWAVMENELEEHSKHFYNVATAASITGFVRAKLWRAINDCEGIIYCDTDSVFCENTAQLELGEKLGQWDIEAHCTEGAFCGKKLYAIKKQDGEFKIASKGGRLTPQDIYKIARGNKVLYQSDAPTFSVKRGNSFIEREFTKTV